jgi:asparagine synthase (glutamine-hydrolysing)
MCGFAGLLSNIPFESVNLRRLAASMASKVRHRGPDSSGVWCDDHGIFSVAHQRLAVLDISPAGSQPMVSKSSRFVLTYNGEIYNHLDIRKKLEQITSYSWNSHSDTETLLVALELWGVSKTLDSLRGMFAIALWDRTRRQLTLARDRFGEKPLYWGYASDEADSPLLFGSDLASLVSYPHFDKRVNHSLLPQFLSSGAISAPHTVYKNIFHLQPGYCITISPNQRSVPANSESWWSFTSMISNSRADIFDDPYEALYSLENSLTDSVKSQSLSDVPLGSFLSGGIDSSLITALLQQNSSHSVRTFTIGFEESNYNEAPFAKRIAQYLGTDHTEATLTSDDALRAIPNIPNFYSEPFADSSQIPTYLVCSQAKQAGLTVALSGDGGDELFGGYNRYFWAPRIWSKISFLPPHVRCLLGKLIRACPDLFWSLVSPLLGISLLPDKANKLATRLRHVHTIDDLYYSLTSEYFHSPLPLNKNFLHALQPSSSFLPCYPLLDDPSFHSFERMMIFDTLNYLPSDILTKVDRASMATSLEVRAPFLDINVAQIAWRLPSNLKINHDLARNSSKIALRLILDKYIPAKLLDRPKAGFGIPLASWLRGPLRCWADELLDPSLLYQQGIFDSTLVSNLWRQHLSTKFDHTSRLWSILMWQAWSQFNHIN